MNRRKVAFTYVVSDFLSAKAAYLLFYIYRKKNIESIKFGTEIPVKLDEQVWVYAFLIALFWLGLYTVSGYYLEILRKSRLRDFIQTFMQVLVGTILLFFLLFLDDEVQNYRNYYQLFFVYFFLQLSLTWFFRLILTTRTVKNIHRGKWGFKTLLVGADETALEIYQEIEKQHPRGGNIFVGYTHLSPADKHVMKNYLPHLGNCVHLKQIIAQHGIEEVIVALDTKEHEQLNKIFYQLEGTGTYIKLKPDMFDLISGSVKTSAIFGAPFIEIKPFPMAPWERAIKRIMDITLSLLSIILLLPLFLIIGILVKITSRGPVIFKQERIGLHGKPFLMYKFRSMYDNAEINGPQLSSQNDPRITPVGRFLRKTRLDEIPQFFNVLKGDMSIVGPRPERQYYIDLIAQKNPHYYHLLKVRPGITSWGQVKFGYAENVDQMIERLKYDILYIENMSLLLDIKIMIYTLLILFRLEGK